MSSKIKNLTLLIFSMLLMGKNLSNGMHIEEIVEKNFGKYILVGLKARVGKQVIIKAFNAGLFITYNDKVMNLKEGEQVTLRLGEDKVKIDGEEAGIIHIERSEMISLIGVSNDGINFRKYRGGLRAIAYDKMIIPINRILAEEYLYGVILCEISDFFPEEAIKAQVIAARTYLYKSLSKRKYKYYDVCDSQGSQVYKGYGAEAKVINSLVDNTFNKVITYNGTLINAYYHSNSGGMTANNEDVWGGHAEPYLRAMDDSPSLVGIEANWTMKFSKRYISKQLGFKVTNANILETKDSRVKKIKFRGDKRLILSGNETKKTLGLPSTIFSVTATETHFIFEGHGSGHGVGLSQWGAYGLARKGLNHDGIIKHYYKGTDIRDVAE